MAASELTDADVFDPTLTEPERPHDVLVMEGAGMRFTPADLDVLKDETGKTMTELVGPDASETERFMTMAWLRLRRQGETPTWESCRTLELEFTAPTPDPTALGLLTSSPPSAASGE